MEKLLNLYLILLEVYTQQVIGIEERIKEAQKEYHIEGIPHKILNSRMFTFDEYLTNIYNRGIYFEEKNRVMPHLISFFATYEKSSDEVKATFESLKPKGKYQQYLDELNLGKGTFSEFLQSKLQELQYKERDYRSPSRPQRSNATRQLAKYREDKEKYEQEIESIKRCRQEANDRIKLFNELLNS